MKQNLTLILMNEAVREGWREWMEKVRRVLPQTDAERPVTWIAYSGGYPFSISGDIRSVPS